MDLKEAQARVDAWISQFEEGYWPPLHNLARLVEEVGELARELNHRYGSKPKRPRSRNRTWPWSWRTSSSSSWSWPTSRGSTWTRP
jgi:NTP pyrophosphatase (non-canonical NTP hydrolase)